MPPRYTADPFAGPIARALHHWSDQGPFDTSALAAAVVGALGTSMAEISRLAHHDLSRGDATLMAA